MNYCINALQWPALHSITKVMCVFLAHRESGWNTNHIVISLGPVFSIHLLEESAVSCSNHQTSHWFMLPMPAEYGTAQLQGNVQMYLKCVWDVSRICTRCMWVPYPFCQTGMHPEHVRDTYEMRAGCIWSACERYLGAELYHSSIIATLNSNASLQEKSHIM